MIRPLRSLHRSAVTALLALLPATLVVILAQRPPAAAMTSSTAPDALSVTVRQESDGHRWLRILAPADLPEVLVYRAAAGAANVDDHARLIGRVEGPITRVDIADDLPGGKLLLFSPPLQRTLLQRPLPSRNAP
jgi:hypothetical protein